MPEFIDSAGTRSIVVRAETGAGLTADVLDRIAGVEGIEWSAAFSSAIDVTSTAIPDGTRTPVRLISGTDSNVWGSLRRTDPLPGLDFFSAVGILAVTTSLLAALSPAIAASRRDPVEELRVP